MDPDPEMGTAVPRLANAKDGSVQAKVVATLSDALQELQGAGYDVVVLRIDGPEEIRVLLRIKASSPDTPVIALVPENEKELKRRVRDSGADDVHLTAPGAAPRIAELDRIFASTNVLLRRSRGLAAANRTLLGNIHLSLARSMGLLEQSLELGGQLSRELDKNLSHLSLENFRPLLVEDDPDQALLLERCFRKLGIRRTLPVLRGGEEAISYLAGEGTFKDRIKFPLPNPLILDLKRPKISGLEILTWVRSQPSFAKLIVFMLTSSDLQQDRDRAMALGLDYYFVKPVDLSALYRTAQLMVLRWSSIENAHRHGPQP